MKAIISPTKTDPRDLRVLLALLREGFTREEVCGRLHISDATYYRRVQELKRIEREAKALAEADF